MFKIESYVTPILLSYVDKYVRDFKPADAQVSLWGGGVALHNLVLKADVLQQEVALPFTLVSGRIHELLIQVPWTKIMSEPIVVTIDTIECVLSLNPPPPPDESPPPEIPSRKTQVVEAPPGYMQALVRRIVSNIALRVHHLIVKYVQDDIVLSLNVKHLAVDSAGANWEPAFADIEQAEPVIRRLVRLDDLTLCLDRADSDGKIRFYQEPLLYRCQLDLRVLTRLVSASTRRASSLSVQLRSTRLAWGVTSEQLVLLLRLMRERTAATKQPPPAPKPSVVQSTPLHVMSSNSAEPARQESWSEWAWSWLPTWMDREGVEETPMPAAPTPIFFTAYLDDVSFVFKVMEVDSSTRKRARGVLELSASHAAIKSCVCAPTTLRVRLGARALTLKSHGRCTCGHLDTPNNQDSIIYLCKSKSEDQEGAWCWPEEDMNSGKIETAEAVDEGYRVSPVHLQSEFRSTTEQLDESHQQEQPKMQEAEEGDDFWRKLAPVLSVEYNHERSPPQPYTNPYDNPPLEFQYSDWVEVCNTRVTLALVELRVCMGLVHRLAAVNNIFKELPPMPQPDLPMRTLTVEECEALCDNLPQRRVNIEVTGLQVRVHPWDHSPHERSTAPPIVLDLELPNTTVLINGPLYPHRVCSAACQMPDDSGPLWQGARLHISAAVSSLAVRINSPTECQRRPCAHLDVRLLLHILLNREFFERRESVNFSYSLKIREAKVCGSAARLQAACHVPLSLVQQAASTALRHTSLAKDALNDSECVAIELTAEEVSARGYTTRHINTHLLSVQSARATAHHATKDEELKQAWLFSAPDAPTTTPYLRFAVQWCTQPVANSLDFVGVWTEPTAVAVDPLLVAWLAYKPIVRPNTESQPTTLPTKPVSTQYFLRRRTTPPSSSGRGASRTGSGAELVHVRPRSLGSSSEPSEKKESKPPPQATKPPEPLWSGEWLLRAHSRLKHMLVSVELGLVLVYVTPRTASALDCATVRDAMERHAADHKHVIAFSLGRLSMHSSSMTKHLWQDIKHDGPTFVMRKPDYNPDDDESFPWKMRLADMSCYTLTARPVPEPLARDQAGGLRSQIKMAAVTPRTVLELVTTTVTLSVVTKSLHIKTMTRKEQKKHAEATAEEERMKYFKGGIDFKPSTLKEFVRGPSKRRKSSPDPEPKQQPAPAAVAGPVVSLGVHVHADTPPIIVRLDYDQMQVVGAALHCFKHILTLVQRAPTATRQVHTAAGGSHRTIISRSVSELEEQNSQSEDTPSENRSELISIFESQSVQQKPVDMKTFFWLQWVVSRATLVVSTRRVKLAFDVDDVISTVDVQQHYNQLKVKLASASVRHYERTSNDDWAAGVLRGRVLEAREPTNAKEDNHFLAVTITQAQISNLPPSWKEELHPKLLEQKTSTDSMWEIYATLAPLEVVLQPSVLENIVSLVHQMSPRSFCPLQGQVEQRVSTWQWPFCYVTAGGLRLLVTTEDENSENDDTFMFVVGKVTVNPHPENPICRRSINAGAESGWLGNAYEGRQYEVLVKNVGIRSAQFSQLVFQEASESEIMKGTGGENPALKWSQPVVSPVITPMLHAVDMGCVVAPALYAGGVLRCGPAVDLSLLSDCAVELSAAQLRLLRAVLADIHGAVSHATDTGSTLEDEKPGVCPYATLLMSRDTTGDSPTLLSDSTLIEETSKSASDMGQSVQADSGVETSNSTYKSSRHTEDTPLLTKKSVSVAFAEQMADASEFLEVFVTMGMIEVSLYTVDDGSPEVVALRPPTLPSTAPTEPVVQTVVEESKETAANDDRLAGSQCSRSLTETIRNADIGKTKLEGAALMSHVRKHEGNLPLLHMTLYQPNLYYWRRKNQKSLQVSLFNAWLGLGVGQVEGQWHAALVSTARGVPDPVTDIPPALATMKIVVPTVGGYTSSGSGRGTVRIDVERPVQIEVSEDRLRRIKGIHALIEGRVMSPVQEFQTPVVKLPFLYKFRRFMVQNSLESVTVHTSQVLVCGSEGTVGWDAACAQAAAGSRPERAHARALITALVVAAGPPSDRRHVLLHPLIIGAELQATWEAWRRAEGGHAACEPTIRLNVDFDRITLDLRPADLTVLSNIQQTVDDLFGEKRPPPTSSDSEDTCHVHEDGPISQPSVPSLVPRTSSVASVDIEAGDHYYKDDLRSGAFKIVSGGQLPMAYQVTVHGNAVSWRYPHPRTVTRIVAFPIPGQDKETECVLELYSQTLGCWQPHTYFELPVHEPRELKLYVTPPDAVFAVMWRVRTYSEALDKTVPFEFNLIKFLPRTDPLACESPPGSQAGRTSVPTGGVTAEQLSGVLRVDSYFAPRLLPRAKLSLRMVAFELNAHNSLPALTSQATALEGYYVSRPLMRSHRVLRVSARDVIGHAHLDSPAGKMLLLDAKLGSNILDSGTGTMEKLVEEFRVRAAASVGTGGPRVRCRAACVHALLHVPRMRTLLSLAADWKAAIDKCAGKPATDEPQPEVKVRTAGEAAAAAAEALEGRVSLWVHNSCASALRIGQEGTDEVVPLGPGARLAYRWRSPVAAKKLRIALAGPTADWRWSNSIPFMGGSTRVRLEDGVHVHVRVEDAGATRTMHLSGRLTLANMLRRNVLYKVRAHCPSSNQWRTVCSGELEYESVGRSVICAADCDMVLKIKFTSHDTGWSGDIPLKECPKENVPWLVKVPSEGEGGTPYMAVWCRVARARSDGRSLAALWPLYVLRSQLPLDTDVMIVTDTAVSSTEPPNDQSRPPPLIQTAPGRGASTHLVAPGTTAARHKLSFQYRNIECPVTREAAPLHYGVTDTSVFDKRTPVNNIEEVVDEVLAWLRRSGRDAKSAWPYSIVAKQWPGEWQPALLQPRSDVTVRYEAVRAGGGCSLQARLSPLVLLCNAAPTVLTLRAHDAAPLCRLEPGRAVAPPSALLQKPFFLSVEVGRETFVSGQLQVCPREPGRYAAPPPGQLALGHAAHIAVQCSHKVALLTMHYEIKEEINVLGVGSTYMLLNRLDNDILVSAIAVPNEVGDDIVLCPKAFKVVPPTKEGSIHGTPLCRFWLRGRWRGGNPLELRMYICLALGKSGEETYPTHTPVPIRVGDEHAPARRAIALIDADNRSVAVVVTQLKQDGRWLISVARDPCPQFVVHNCTSCPLAVAQPVHFTDEPSTSYINATPECSGVRWWCVVQPNAVTHYSSPAHCARYPPPATPAPPTVPFLIFAKAKAEDDAPQWCAAVAAAEGEQLVQVCGGVTVKLRVRTHHHTTLLELHDVDHRDISASDIRRRLLGPFISQDSANLTSNIDSHSKCGLQRIAAEEKLLNVSTVLQQTPTAKKAEVDLQKSTVAIARMESVASGSTVQTNETLQVPDERVQNAGTLVPLDGNVDAMKALTLTGMDDGGGIESEIEKSPLTKKGETDPNNLGDTDSSNTAFTFNEVPVSEWERGGGGSGGAWPQMERVRCVVDAVVLEVAAATDARPLLALHADHAALHMLADRKRTRTTLSISDVQIDNLQYDSGQYDFAVVASTRGERSPSERWPPLWSMFAEQESFESQSGNARLTLALQHDKWTVANCDYNELTEVEISLGPLALYVEDAYVSALVSLWRLALPATVVSEASAALADERTLQRPLRLRTLHVQPLDLTLTLHTAVRMYIALDQSPLRLSAFRLQDMVTSPERLTHALTVHYLSAAILGAGWVVGGLELLGAPGALAARVGGATGGVRGVASAAAAALLRSLSAWAGSLARNLDLLAGDEEHARRAAAARRRPPPSFVAGLAAGITNFAINILGAVGGLAHHPLVGVAVGETESGAAALRRGLLGALTKPLSATADLVAYAGHGLLTQTGWDPVPQPRTLHTEYECGELCISGWRRDCVRWTFRLADLSAVDGFEVLLDNAPLQLLITHKFLVVADPETERIVEMIDFRFCTLHPFQGHVIELCVTQRRPTKASESRAVDEDDEFQISAAAMARVARYTGAEGTTAAEARVLAMLPAPARAHALYATLTSAIHHNADTHFPLL
ncbi:intermembrane lipid transfer protein VPS13B isoform X4 [Galleria mellonella]|uniref:Intermembrane lipid transfer protein VPS13B isoform X4 n=1 Tax=Galleria mellonella TaxID=7137 RepID=A0ABM3MMI8_GALME|nr:intermembrane lipid transfer protein VPS13B isoform X4 [Galleria mellonella]